MKDNKFQQPYTISVGLQKIFIGFSVLAYLLQAAFMVAQLIKYDGFGAGSVLVYNLVTLLFPAYLFVFAYLVNVRGQNGLARISECVLMATIGTIAVTVVLEILGLISIWYPTINMFSWTSFLYSWGVTAIAAAIYSAIILIWRYRSRRQAK